MKRALALAAACAALAAGATSSGAGGAAPGAGRDVRQLGRQLEQLHPNLFRHVTRARFEAAVERAARRAPALRPNELLVELMRIAALPGARNGHTGIFPGDGRHRRQLSLYPVRLYWFSDGVHVVDEEGERGLVGARLVAIAGVPVERIARLVRPLVPHDNELSLKGYLPHFALCAEVLDGLGVGRGTGARAFTFERGGERLDVRLEPLPAATYLSEFADPLHGHYPSALPTRPRPMYLAEQGRPLWIRTLDGGRAIYVGYNSATAPTYEVSTRLRSLARRRGVERVIVDVRLNGGGDNTSYGPLVGVLADPLVDRPRRLFVLIGRATFSAAGNFAAEVDRETGARFVGEPTGGGVNQYGDATTFSLPALGWNVYVATTYTRIGTARDPRLAVLPDVPVQLASADFLAGRDPVLQAALDAS